MDEGTDALLRTIVANTELTREQIIESAERLAEADGEIWPLLQPHYVAEATHYLLGGEVPADRRAIAMGPQ